MRGAMRRKRKRGKRRNTVQHLFSGWVGVGWGGEGGGALETHKLSSGYCNRPLGGGGLVQHGLHEGNQFRRRKRGGGMREGGEG